MGGAAAAQEARREGAGQHSAGGARVGRAGSRRALGAKRKRARQASGSRRKRAERAGREAAGAAGARGSRGGRGARGVRPGRAASAAWARGQCAPGCAQLGQVGVLCTLTRFLARFDSVFFPSHQMNTVHCKLIFEKKIILNLIKIK